MENRNTCKAVRGCHRAAAKELGKGYTSKGVAAIEGEVEAGLEAIGRGEKVEWMDAEAEQRLRKLMGELERAGEAGVEWTEEEKMVEIVKEYEWARVRTSGRTDYKTSNDANEIRDMKIGGKQRIEAARSIAVRFTDKVGELCGMHSGIKRGEVIRGKKVGRDKVGGVSAIFDSVRADMSRERGNVEQLLGLYRELKEKMEAGEEVREVVEKIEKLEVEDVRLNKIGREIDKNGRVIYAEGYSMIRRVEGGVDAKIEALEKAVGVYDDILGSWTVLCRLSSKDIWVLEGVKIDGQLKIREDREEIAMESVDGEAEPGELFRTASEFRAAWKSVPNEIRSLLARMAERDRYTMQPKYNEIGDVVYMNERRVFEQLMMALRMSGDSSEMMANLADLVERMPEYGEIEALLKKDGRLRTDMWQSMKRGFQPYSQFFWTWADGIRTLRTTILNGRLDKVRKSVTTMRNNTKIKYGTWLLMSWVRRWGDSVEVGDGVKLDGKDAMLHGEMAYDHSGKTNEDVAKRLDAIVGAWYLPISNNTRDGRTYMKEPLLMSMEEASASRRRGDLTIGGDMALWDQMRYNVLIETANAVGIELTPEMAMGLLGNTALLRTFVESYREAMYELVYSKWGEVPDGEKWKKGIRIASGGMVYPRISGAGSPGQIWIMEEALERIDWVRSRATSHGDYSHRVSAKKRGREGDATYESAIEPSWLSEHIDGIKKADKGRVGALREYLDKEWLGDEKYMKGDTIFNPWLRHLHYDAVYRDNGVPKGDSSRRFSEVFDFTRDLGTSEKPFEDMSDKEHVLQMIYSFYEDERVSNGDKAIRNIVYLSAEEFAGLMNEMTEAERINTENEEKGIDEFNYYTLLNNGTCRYIVDGEVDWDNETGRWVAIPSSEEEDGYLPQNIVTFYVIQDEKSKGSVSGDARPNYSTAMETNRRKIPCGRYQMLPQGDAGASRYISAPRYSVDGVVEHMYGLYQGEIARMQQVREMRESGYDVKSYIKRKDGKDNSERLTMLTFLNKRIDSLWEDYQKDGTCYGLEDGTTVESKYELMANLDPQAVKAMIQESLEFGLEKFLAGLDEMGVLETEVVKENKKERLRYKDMEGIIGNNAIAADRVEGDNEETMQNTLKRRMRDFYYNHRLAQLSMMGMFGGDASMFGGPEDMVKRWKQTVANGTMLDMSAEFTLLDGKTIDKSIGMVDRYERSLYVKDIKANTEEFEPEYMASIVMHYSKRLVSADEALEMVKAKDHEKIKDLLGENIYRWRYEPYTENTLTDGQAWRCLTSYRSVRIKQGTSNWTEREERAYQRIKQLGRDAKAAKRELMMEEVKEIEELSAVFQPLKPFSFGFEEVTYDGKNDDGNTIPKTAKITCQHKCADVVLIPELLEKGSKLRAMAEMMEDSFEEADKELSQRNGDVDGMVRNKIDVIYSSECVKVGLHHELDLTGSAEELKTRLIDASISNGFVHKLSWENFRIQQNNPEHVNEERRIGTQLMKIVMSDLNFGPDADYKKYFDDDRVQGIINTDADGRICIGYDANGEPLYASEKLSALQLTQLYQTQFIANLLDSLKDFERRLINEKSISNEVIATLMENMRANIDTIYGLMMEEGEDGVERFVMPMFESSVERDVIGALLSMFRNTVNKQTMMGGSAVQQSPLGLRASKKEDDGDTGDLHCSYDAQHNMIDVECELSWKEEYIDSRGRKVALRFEDWNERGEDGQWELKRDADGVPLLEKEFPGILNMIAYRIPTERCYSILNLRVKRFTPMTAGGVIKVPHQFTTVAGFDFDIDKLYLLRKSFEETKSEWERLELDKDQRRQIVEKIKELHPEYTQEIPEVTEETFSESQLWEIFGAMYGYQESGDEEVDKLVAAIFSEAGTTAESLNIKGVPGLLHALQNARKLDEDNHVKETGKPLKKGQHLHPLNWYFDESPWVEKEAKKHGYESSKDWKQALVGEYAAELGMLPETTVKVKDGFLAIDKDAVAAAGVKMGSLWREAANELGIALGEEKREKRWKEYDLGKPPLEQESSGVRTNLILHIMQQRLSDPETFVSRTTPGGFDNAKAVSKEMYYLNEEAEENESIADALSAARKRGMGDAIVSDNDFSEPLMLVRYNRQNQIASKLIGIFANHSTNNIFSQLLDKFSLGHGIDENGKGYDHRIVMFGRFGEYLVYHDDQETKEQTDKLMAELLAASVDAVKDPVLDNLNITEDTANVVALMVRTGFNFEQIGLFLNQPIIKEVCSLMRRRGFGADRAIKEVESRYFGGNKCEAPSDTKIINENGCVADILAYRKAAKADRDYFEETYERGRFVDRTRKESSDPKWLEREDRQTDLLYKESGFGERQQAVLGMFADMVVSAQQLSDWLMTTKYTASGTIGTTAGEVYSMVHKTESKNEPRNFEIEYTTPGGEKSHGKTIRYEEKIGDESVEDMLEGASKEPTERNKAWARYIGWCSRSVFGIEQAMYNCMKFAMKRTIGKTMPYEKKPFRKIVELVESIAREANLRGNMLDGMFREKQLWDMAQYRGSLYDLGGKYLKTVKWTHYEYEKDENGRNKEYIDKRGRKILKILSSEEKSKVVETTLGVYLEKDFAKDFMKFVADNAEMCERYTLLRDGINIDGRAHRLAESGGTIDKTYLTLSSAVLDEKHQAELMTDVRDIMNHWKNRDGGTEQKFYDEAMEMLMKLYVYGLQRGGLGLNTHTFNRIFPTDFKRSIVVADFGDGNNLYYDDVLRAEMDDSTRSDKEVDDDVKRFITAYVVKHLADCRGMIKWLDEKMENKELYESMYGYTIEGYENFEIPLELDDDLKAIAVAKTEDGYIFPPVIIAGKPKNVKKAEPDNHDAQVWMLVPESLEGNGFEGSGLVKYVNIGYYYEVVNRIVNYNADKLISIVNVKNDKEVQDGEEEDRLVEKLDAEREDRESMSLEELRDTVKTAYVMLTAAGEQLDPAIWGSLETKSREELMTLINVAQMKNVLDANMQPICGA